MKPKLNLPYRQIHLDYHTGTNLGPIAKEFQKEDFKKTLVDSHVNSIALFARCHHGYIYYPSEKFKERIHPDLENTNLLIEQIEACKEANIRCVVYLTIQWDDYSAKRNYDWLCKDIDGLPITPMFTPGFYRYLCVNSPYLDFLKDHIKDILDVVKDFDGFFFDIVWPKTCVCPYCIEKMNKERLDWQSKRDRDLFSIKTIEMFTNEITSYVHSLNKNLSVYYNDGAISPDSHKNIDSFTHLEFDALPSGHGSYTDFPIIIRQNRHYNIDYAGHTGKFHQGWGDMHTYKNLHALEYECFMQLALSSKCIIGDQLPPSGKLDKPAYETIKKVYSKVEKMEPFLIDAFQVKEIGVFSTDNEILRGVHKVLSSLSYMYDIINIDMDFTPYKLIILPDNIIVDSLLKNKIENYLKQGGLILASFLSLKCIDRDEFAIDLGIKFSKNQIKDVEGNLVRGKFYKRHDYCDYIKANKYFDFDDNKSPHAMYTTANHVKPTSSSKILPLLEPQYYRTQNAYYSHMQTPYIEKDSNFCAATLTEQTIYLAHNVFSIYNRYAPLFLKKYIDKSISLLLGNKIVNHNGPSTLDVILNHQPNMDRFILHLLHYVPIKRATELEIIEEIYPLYNLEFKLNIESKNISSIEKAISNKKIAFSSSKETISFNLDILNGHEIIVLKY